MPEAKAAPSAPNTGKNKGGAYQDRDKPAQIRYSNISAAKGRLKHLDHQGTDISRYKIQLWIQFLGLELTCSGRVPLFIVIRISIELVLM